MQPDVSQIPTQYQNWAQQKLQQGFNMDQINSSLQTAQPAVTGSQPNFLEKLLPTAGSILGGIGGALIPGLGETGISEVGGSAAGSAIGQGIEDALTGQKSSVGDIGGAALEGAAGAGIGKGLTAISQGAAGAAARLAGDKVEQAAGGALKDEFGGVTKSTRENLNMNSNASTFANYGQPFTSENINKIAPIVTGSADSPEGQAILHKGTVTAMVGANPVDLTGVQSLAQRIAGSPDMAAAGPTVGKAFLNDVVNRLPTGSGDSGIGTLVNAPAPATFEAQQALESAAYDTKNPALSQGYKDVAGALDDALQKAGANDIVAKGLYSPQDLQTLSQVSPKLADAAANVSTVGENRALQRPFVQASLLAKAANKASEGAFDSGTPATSSGGNGILGKLTGGMLPKLEGLGGGAEALMGHPAVGLPLMAASYLQQNPEVTASLLSKFSGSGLPGVLGQVAGHAPSLGSGTDTTQGGQMNDQFQTTGASTGGPSMAAAAFFPSLAPFLQQAQQAQATQPMLNSLESAYGSAGGGQGLPGILSAISSLVPGTKANLYNQQKVQAAAAISKATGMPMASVLASLPSLMASQSGAENEFGGLQGSLSTLQSSPQFGMAQSILGGVQ